MPKFLLPFVAPSLSCLIISREDQDAGLWGGSCRLVHQPSWTLLPFPSPLPLLPCHRAWKTATPKPQPSKAMWHGSDKGSIGSNLLEEFQGHACSLKMGGRWQGLSICQGCGRKGFERPGSLLASRQQLLPSYCGTKVALILQLLFVFGYFQLHELLTNTLPSCLPASSLVSFTAPYLFYKTEEWADQKRVVNKYWQ